MITIKEIAQQAGFSPSTVSRLLSNDPSLSVSPETKQKILNTALSLGYERKYIKTIIEKIALLFWITEIEELEDIYFKDIFISRAGLEDCLSCPCKDIREF